MARRKITPEFYEALTAAFRQVPGNASEAAALVREAMGSTCDPRTAARAWDRGWPRLELEPIAARLEKEKIAARAKLAHDDTAKALAAATSDEAVVREQARIDAINARTAEGRLVRVARENVLALLESSNELLEGYRLLAPKVKKLLAKMDADDLGITESARLLWRIAIAARASTAAGLQVLQMERLLLGQPMEIIGIRDMELDESDVLVELEEAAEMAARIRERRGRREGRLRLLQGGKIGELVGHGGNGTTTSSRPTGAKGKGSTT